MEKGRKGRQKREEKGGVENKMRGREKRKIWNEKDSQGREEKRKGVRKIKFKSCDRIP